MSPLPLTRTAKDVVLDVLESIAEPSIDVFDGNVDDRRVTIAGDGNVQGYAVLWWTPGVDLQQRLCPTPDARQLTFQITAVGGDTNRCLGVADALQATLIGRRLTLPDGVSTPIRNYDFGNGDVVSKDPREVPERYFVPLLYSCRLA